MLSVEPGCQEAILKEGKRGEKIEVCQNTRTGLKISGNRSYGVTNQI